MRRGRERGYGVSRLRGLAVPAPNMNPNAARPRNRKTARPLEHSPLHSRESFPSRALLPPRFFAGGEGADRRMRGAFHAGVICTRADHACEPLPICTARRRTPSTLIRGSEIVVKMIQAAIDQCLTSRENLPPHPPSAPSPPAEKRWGRRALDGRALPRMREAGPSSESKRNRFPPPTQSSEQKGSRRGTPCRGFQ